MPWFYLNFPISNSVKHNLKNYIEHLFFTHLEFYSLQFGFVGFGQQTLRQQVKRLLQTPK